MPRPKRDYDDEFARALATLERWLSSRKGVQEPMDADTLAALEVLLPRSVETVDDIDEMARGGDTDAG